MKKLSIIVCTLLLFTACTDRPDNVQQVNEQPKIFPDYAGVTFLAVSSTHLLLPTNFRVLDSAEMSVLEKTKQ